MKKITLTIDDKICKGKEGSTILEVCRANDIYVPTLCHREGLSNTGACRMCLVEIEGIASPQTACSMVASDGMKVKTNTEKLRDLRKINLELILSEKPHFCMFCPKSGDCELQSLSYEYGVDHSRFNYMFNKLPIDTSHPYLIVDHNHCILCGRCIRTCQEIVGNCTLGFKERGWETTTCADLDQPLGSSSCISCGACFQACPTGTISGKFSLFMGKKEDCEVKQAFCPLCGQGCEINAFVRGNNLVRIEGVNLAASDGGQLCSLGRFGLIAETRSRLTAPLIRNSRGILEEVSWDEALDFIAEGLKPIKLKPNARAVAGFISSQSSSEEILLFQEFMGKAIGSKLIDTLDGNAFRAISEAIMAFGKKRPKLGIGCKPEEILQADRVVVVGADPIHTHPVVASFIRRAVLQGGKVLMIEAEKDFMSPWTGTYLKPKRGTEWLLMGGLANLLSQKTTTGRKGKSQKIPRELRDFSPNLVCKNTGVETEDLARCAKLLTESQKVVFVCDPSRLNNKAIISLLNLALIAVGSPNAPLKVIFLPPQGNSLAAWKLKTSAAVDLTAAEQKRVKAAFVIQGDENIDEVMLDSLKSMDLVVAHCSYHSTMDSVAHVILPVPIWAERKGTYSALDGKMLKQPIILCPPVGVKDNLWIMTELSKRLGCELKYQSPRILASEVKKKLKMEGLF